MTKESLRRWWHITRWRLRYLWLDTSFGRWMHIGAAILMLIVAVLRLPAALGAVQSGPVHAEITLFTQIVIMVVLSLISIALTPKQPDAVDQVIEAPRLKDGAGVRMVFGEVWITDPDIIGWKKMGTKTIRGKKSGFNGRPIIGYWYKQLFHFLLCRGPVDAVLEFRGGDKTAWKGELTATGEVQINQRELWGGQGTGGEGGIEGPMQFLFGDAAQMPSSYLASNLDPKQPAYRGLLTALFKSGLWGAFSPYPKAASFKVRRILEGWDREDGAWYPERALVPLTEADRVLRYFENFDGGIGSFVLAQGSIAPFSIVSTPYGQGMQTAGGAAGVIKKPLPLYGRINSLDVMFLADSDGSDDFCTIDFFDSTGRYIVGFNVCREEAYAPGRPPSAYFSVVGADVNLGNPLGATRVTLGNWYRFTASFDAVTRSYNCRITSASDGAVFYEGVVPLGGGSGRRASAEQIVFRKEGGAGGGTISAIELSLELDSPKGGAMNPAHMLYQSITDSWMGAEPEAGISDASFRAAADTLYAEGFGLCTEWDSTTESVEQFQQRICDVIGANLSRSPVDGLWYLDLIRGGYDLNTLPVLTDDDIIEYSEQPGTMQDAVNQIIVEWRDPKRREDRSTAPVQSLGSIQAAGVVVGEVATYREIPEESLALRVAGRNLQLKARPLRRSSIKTTRIAHAWRPGQVFRLQSTKRGIADMALRIGDLDRGTLRSGAIAMTALQDVFGLPQAVYVSPDPTPAADDDVPNPVAASSVKEVPYALLAALQPPGELGALPADSGYLFAVAAPAGGELDYSLQVDAGAGYEEQAESDWSATATSTASTAKLDTVIGITAARGLDDVVIGAMVLWGNEICRLDSVDLIAGTVTLGRGCADTVPAAHAASERLWVIDDSIALDATRYSSGASVLAKLLPRSTSQRLGLADADVSVVTLASRAARPYPPAAVTLNGSDAPVEIFAVADVAWLHRDRVASAAQLIDQAATSIGPEAGTTYTVRWYLDGVLDHTDAGVGGTTASHAPSADGLLRVEVEAVRDGLVSWQMQVIECAYRVTPYSDYADQNGDIYADQNGDTYLG